MLERVIISNVRSMLLLLTIIFSSVNLKQYATGQSLLEAGAVSGHDMTVECAAIKLGYLMVGFLMEVAR